MSTSSTVLLPKLPGVDVSSYQGVIDWKVLAPHIRFAFLKATDGARIIDSQLVNNVKGATDNGIPFGLYHFYRNGGPTECDRFLEILNKYPSQLPPVLDLEVRPLPGAASSFIHDALAVLGAIGKYAHPMVYTSPFFAATYLNLVFTQYPLWVAEYTSAAEPTLSQWAGWDFWQWSGVGRLPGVSDQVDLDWCLDEPTLDALMRVPT